MIPIIYTYQDLFGFGILFVRIISRSINNDIKIDRLELANTDNKTDCMTLSYMLKKTQ